MLGLILAARSAAEMRDFPGKASVLYLIPSTGIGVYHVGCD